MGTSLPSGYVRTFWIATTMWQTAVGCARRSFVTSLYGGALVQHMWTSLPKMQTFRFGGALMGAV